MAHVPASSDLPTDAFPTGNALSSTRGGLSADTKKRAAISAAALLLAGGGALAYMTSTKETGEPVPSADTNLPDEAAPAITLPSRADLANDVNDSMSFANAFEVAREEVGLGGVFTWHNRAYNTFTKEEWAGLSLQQRQEYAEHVLDMGLPVAVQSPVVSSNDPAAAPVSQPATTAADPTVIEGTIADRRVMGIDQDNDGVIDMLVIEGDNGYTYQVADASGDQGLDTVYMYDAVKDEYVLAARLDQPVVLTNEAFNQGLEESMSKEVVDSIMTEPSPNSVLTDADPGSTEVEADAVQAETSLNEAYEEDGYGDTYVNNANVSDMDEAHQ